jgi:pyruvate ferredoxin oxidoreductase alpha subunit
MTTVKEDKTVKLSHAINGGEAVAYAMRQVDPEVVAAYPITPQTFIIEKFSEFVADGEVNTEYINVESEHAALSACVGASAAGARTATATSGPGLALMFEIVGVTSGMRLPVVMHLCSRALSAPLNILCDHSDAMAMRDQSWVMMFGSNPQEAYDQALIAHTVAEHPDVKLPFSNVLDGFTVTHSVERVDTIPDDVAKQFVGEYEPEIWALQPGGGATFGGLDANDFYYEHKRQQVEAMKNALRVAEEQLNAYAEISGRKYSLVESYKLEDADVALVVLGSSEGMVRAAVDDARKKGIRAGMLRVRLFRPFPVEAVRGALASVRAIGVLDRAISYGAPGNALLQDVRTSTRAMSDKPLSVGFVYGLGGRATPKQEFTEAINHVTTMLEQELEPDGPIYLGLH